MCNNSAVLGKSGVLTGPNGYSAAVRTRYVGVTCRKYEIVHIAAVAASSLCRQLPLEGFAPAVP